MSRNFTRGRVCAVADCGRPAKSREWCNAHYKRWHKYGDPLAVTPPRRKRSVEERFWSFVDKTERPDGCWLWTGSIRKPYGYGQFTVEDGNTKTTWTAHAFAYDLAHGWHPTRSDGLELELRHLCGNGNLGCVRPDHLVPGTRQENAQDRIGHGRGSGIIPRDQIPVIRQRVAAGENRYALAEEYGVTYAAITDVVLRRTYRYIA